MAHGSGNIYIQLYLYLNVWFNLVLQLKLKKK